MKPKNLKRFRIVLGITLMLSSCFPDQWYGIRILNNSNQELFVYGAYILPDTAIAQDKPRLTIIEKTRASHIFGYDIEDEKLTRFVNEKLTIFILAKDVVEQNSWEDIRVNYLILKRYEINERDLINMGGTVTYP
jgi:hypothetical protein